MSLSQFHGRDFVDGGSTTSGDAVLRGLRIAPGAPLYPMFLGHLGFIAVVLALALLLLSTWTPGGVRHARRVPADAKGKELAAADLDLARARVELRAHALQLAYVRRHLPSLRRSATPVLTRVSAVFPPGAVTVVMGPSGSGKSTLLRLLAGRPLAGGALGAFVPAGAVTLNGAPLSARNRHACALVEQEGAPFSAPSTPTPLTAPRAPGRRAPPAGADGARDAAVRGRDAAARGRRAAAQARARGGGAAHARAPRLRGRRRRRRAPQGHLRRREAAAEPRVPDGAAPAGVWRGRAALMRGAD
jgi:hypothetical protein